MLSGQLDDKSTMSDYRGKPERYETAVAGLCEVSNLAFGHGLIMQLEQKQFHAG